MSSQAKTQRITLTLVVDYDLNGVDPVVMKNNLERMCSYAIGEGMLTGHTEAEVESHMISTTVHQEGPFPLSVSLDGGVTYAEAKEGVRVAYPNSRKAPALRPGMDSAFSEAAHRSFP